MSWSNTQKIAFRFFACYFFFYCMSNQFVLSFAFEAVWQKIVPWFAANVLGLEEEAKYALTGSGDSLYNYVSVLLYAIVSLIATLIWSILDRNRPNYEKGLQWLIVLIRYYLIYQMILYGLAKVFYMQFQPPRFARLIQPYGDSSPMGLLWTFMGFSKGYTVFAGLGEVMGGLLLLFRRTVTLGAILILGVMGNVMAMNFFYDVPVKLLSSHIVLMAAFLLALDAKRLWNVFIVNEPAPAKEIVPLFKDKDYIKAKNIIKWLLVAAGLGFFIFTSISQLKVWGPNAPKPPLYGLYETKHFEVNGDTIQPLMTDSTRWRYLAIDWKNRAMIQTMTGKKIYYDFKPDTTTNWVHLNVRRDTVFLDSLAFSYPDSAQLLLEGIHKNDTLKILMQSKKKEDFLLINRGFRWVNETPFNR